MTWAPSEGTLQAGPLQAHSLRDETACPGAVQLSAWIRTCLIWGPERDGVIGHSSAGRAEGANEKFKAVAYTEKNPNKIKSAH